MEREGEGGRGVRKMGFGIVEVGEGRCGGLGRVGGRF